MTWEPDYVDIYQQRLRHITAARRRENAALLFEFYKNDPVAWINDWVTTYDPRAKEKYVPFVLFQRQVEFIQFLQSCLNDKAPGLVEKSRDVGATWLCAAFATWLMIYHQGTTVGFGSRTLEMADKIGDANSILEKVRIIISKLPAFMIPRQGISLAWKKILNPANGSSIIAAGGDEIGRGGRSTIFFKDEALALSEKILTIDGWKPMGELTMKDQVIGTNGKPQKITNIRDCGEFEIYRVGFSDGNFIECSPHHLWNLNVKRGKRENKTIRTEELYKTYKYTSPQGKILYRYTIPSIDPVDFNRKKKLILHPYVVGCLIGDGGVSQVPKHSPKLTSADPELVEHFTSFLPKYCTIKKSGKIEYILGDVRGRMGWKYKSRIRQAIVEIGIAGKRSWEKFIPEDYKFSSIKDRIQMLQGLMDTDGSAGKSQGSCAYYTSSKQLADDVRFLVNSLGGYATLKIKKDKRGFRDQYVVFVILPKDIKPFFLPRKLKIFEERKNGIERSITSVEKLNKTEPVRCISVTSNDHLYLANAFIPTHNSAHYERPEKIEAALSENTEVQIDISSVNGVGNIFYRKRMSGDVWHPDRAPAVGKTRVFIFDWRDNPMKTQAWYDEKRQKYADDGLLHIFAQEVDRDYSSAVQGVVIPADWVRAAIDAHKRLGFSASGARIAALDVGGDEEGGDKSAFGARHGVVMFGCEMWGETDTTITAQNALDLSTGNKITELYYDAIGVGAGVKGEMNRLKKTDQWPKYLRVYPWIASASPLDPDEPVIKNDEQSPLNGDFFLNLKAQSWWRLRMRFEKTWRAVTKGVQYPPEQLISLDSQMDNLYQLMQELSQVVYKKNGAGKILIDKKPAGTVSPNLADMTVMCYNPVKEVSSFDIVY